MIASGAIVMKDVAPYAIVGGNPAVELRKRFDDTTIEKLLALGIYQWPEEKFTSLRDVICAADIDTLEAAGTAWYRDNKA